MTNKQRLISLVGFQPSQESVDGALEDAGIEASENYIASVSKYSIKKCSIELLELLLSTPDQSNETGYAVKFDRSAAEKRLYRLRVEVGDIVEVKAKLRDKSWLH